MLSRDEHFRTIAYRLSPYFNYDTSDFRVMLEVVDEMASYIETVQTTVQAELNHDILVNITLNLESVMYEVVYDKKISAIKKFREITSCGLKTAKDVIEDDRVWSHRGTAVPPHPQSAEPPF